MKRLLHILSLSLLAAGSLALTSCSTPPAAGTSGSDVTASGERVNTKPWSRPERWEGQGPLGSVMQQRDPNMY